jgi:hypothetical protein
MSNIVQTWSKTALMRWRVDCHKPHTATCSFQFQSVKFWPCTIWGIPAIVCWNMVGYLNYWLSNNLLLNTSPSSANASQVQLTPNLDLPTPCCLHLPHGYYYVDVDAQHLHRSVWNYDLFISKKRNAAKKKYPKNTTKYILIIYIYNNNKNNNNNNNNTNNNNNNMYISK